MIDILRWVLHWFSREVPYTVEADVEMRTIATGDVDIRLTADSDIEMRFIAADDVEL